MSTSQQAPEVARLDVRPILASGGEPLALILAAADRVPPGGVLELTSPFEPLPLYPVMEQRGFVWTPEARAPAEWVVRFRATGIGPTATVAAIAEQHPATREVFARQGLDLCCGGAKTLAFAAKAHGIDLDVLLRELRVAAGG